MDHDLTLHGLLVDHYFTIIPIITNDLIIISNEWTNIRPGFYITSIEYLLLPYCTNYIYSMDQM